MGYFDGNTVTALLELRAALRAERQQLRHDERPVDARRAEPAPRATTTACCAGRRLRSTASVPECGAPVVVDRDACAHQRHDRHVRRRHRSVLGRLLAGLDRGADRPQHRRPADRGGRDVGMVPGRLHARRERQVLVEPCARSVRPRRRRRSRDGHAALPGLRAAPQPVPVLRVDREPAAPAADVGRDGRQDGPGEAPVRPHVVLGSGERRTTCPPCRSSRRRRIRTGIRATRTRSTSRNSSCAR